MFPSHQYMKELADAAEMLVTCRDFCGNEHEALAEWEADNRKLSDAERDMVRRHADRIWNVSRAAAGVFKK